MEWTGGLVPGNQPTRARSNCLAGMPLQADHPSGRESLGNTFSGTPDTRKLRCFLLWLAGWRAAREKTCLGWADGGKGSILARVSAVS
jgi:hypothetical protein